MGKSTGPKIELRGRGISGFSPEDLERRARELAVIDNRAAVTDVDRERARAELEDRELPDAINEDADTTQSMSRDPSDPMVDRGHQVASHGDEDQKTVLEKMTLEGVEEAQHDQMLESRATIDEPLRSRPRDR